MVFREVVGGGCYISLRKIQWIGLLGFAKWCSFVLIWHSAVLKKKARECKELLRSLEQPDEE